MTIKAILALMTVASTSPATAQTPDQTKTYIDAGFASMDANKDGKIERTEFDVFMRARLARQAASFDDAFAKLDTDSNGVISKAEAAGNSQLAQHFKEVDADKNGTLSKGEIRAAMLAAQAREMGAD